MKEIDKCRRRFLWCHDEDMAGGKCKVAWDRVCSPVEHGGLGILNLQKFSRAMCLRWLWLAWQSPLSPWTNFQLPCDAKDREMFHRATTVTIGNGKTANFWCCRWLGNESLQNTFLVLFKHSRRKNRSVAEALANDQWIRDLQHGNSVEIAVEFLAMWRLIRGTHVVASVPDKLTWSGGPGGAYSASSAYKMQFQEIGPTCFRQLLWKPWAPNKLKIFMWLLYLDHLWCNDRLQRRGWPNGYFCPLCRRNLETSVHLIWHCPFSLQVWAKVASWRGCAALLPRDQPVLSSTIAIFHNIDKRSAPEDRRGVRTMLLLVAREI